MKLPWTAYKLASGVQFRGIYYRTRSTATPRRNKYNSSRTQTLSDYTGPVGPRLRLSHSSPPREVMKSLMVVNTTSLNGQLHVNVRNKCQCQHHQRGSNPTLHIGQEAGVTWFLSGIPKTEHCKARDCLNLLAPICSPPHGAQQFYAGSLHEQRCSWCNISRRREGGSCWLVLCAGISVVGENWCRLAFIAGT